MTIDVQDQDGVKVLRLSGELAGGECSPLVETVTELLANRRARLVLDLSGVPFVNSAGLGELVRLVAQANVQEGRVVLAAVSAYLGGVLELTRLDRFFETSPTVAEAVQRLA